MPVRFLGQADSGFQSAPIPSPARPRVRFLDEPIEPSSQEEPDFLGSASQDLPAPVEPAAPRRRTTLSPEQEPQSPDGISRVLSSTPLGSIIAAPAVMSAATKPDNEVRQNVAEFIKAVPGGTISTVGTAITGAGATAQGFNRSMLDLMDRIDRGEAVPESDDPLGYQHMSLEERAASRAQMTPIAERPVAENPLVKTGRDVSEFGRKLLPAEPGYEESIGRQLGSGVGSTLAGLGLGVIPGVGPVATAGMFTLAGSGEAVERALKDGATEDQIIQSARLGALPGMTDSLPVETLLGRVPVPGVGFIKIPVGTLGSALKSIGRIGWQAFVEGVQEGGQQFLQNLIAREVYKPEQELGEGVAPESGVGAGVGAISEIARQAITSFAGRRGGRAAPPQGQERVEPIILPPGGGEGATGPSLRPTEGSIPRGAVPAETILPAPVEEQQPGQPTPDLRALLDDERPLKEILTEREETVREEIRARGTGESKAPVKIDAPEDVHRGAEITADPTPAQAEAGNYRKRHVAWQGLDIAIETEQGQARSGVGPDNRPWSVEMPAPYGYVKRTEGRDGDQIDIYLGPQPDSGQVFVIDQIDPATGKFDEHKAMIGFGAPADALAIYNAAFSDGSGLTRIGAVTPMTADEFKTWLHQADTKKPVAYIQSKAVETAPLPPGVEPSAAHPPAVRAPRRPGGSYRPATHLAGYGTGRQQSAILRRARARLVKEFDENRVTVRQKDGRWALAIRNATQEEDSRAASEVERQTQITLRRAEIGRQRGIPRGNRPMGLAEVIAREGGITDPGGELKAMDQDKWHIGKPVMPRLVVEETAQQAALFAGERGVKDRSPDYWLERAIERGYLQDDATLDDLFEAIQQNRLTPQEQQAEDERGTAERDAEERGRAKQDIEAYSEERSLNLSQAEVEMALERVAHGMPVEDAIEDALERSAIEGEEQWGDIEGEAQNAAQVQEPAVQEAPEPTGKVRPGEEAAHPEPKPELVTGTEGGRAAPSEQPREGQPRRVNVMSYREDRETGASRNYGTAPSADEQRLEGIAKKVRAIQDYLASGNKVRLATSLRVTPYSKPDQIRMGKDGAYVLAGYSRGKPRWDFIFEAHVDQLYKQTQKPEQRESRQIPTESAPAPTAPTSERDAFLRAYRKELIARYGWAQDEERLARFMKSAEATISTNRSDWDHKGEAVTAAYKSIGGEGRPSLKALRALRAYTGDGIQAEAGVPESTPADSYTLAEHTSDAKRVNEGDMTADEAKAAFERVIENKESVIAELNGLTKKELEKYVGPRYSNEKKDRLVKAAYEGILSTYHVGEGFTWSPFSETYEAALRRIIAKQTNQDFKDYAARRKERAAKMLQTYTNPQTLDEFRSFISVRGMDKLSSEQKAKYDELVAEENKAKAEREKEKAVTVKAVDVGNVEMSIVETKHTQKGHDLFVVRLSERVPGNVYSDLNRKAHQLGGRYSSYSKGDAVPGFQFRTREAAEKFVALKEGDVSRKDQVEARETEVQGNAIQRLRTIADKMEADADERLNADRLVNTSRRARMAASADAGARADKAMALTMRSLADAIESGEAKHLENIRTRADVETLTSVLSRARHEWAQQQLKKDRDLRFEKLMDGPVTDEMIQAAKYPYPRAQRENAADLAKAVAEKPGAKLAARRIATLAEEARKADRWSVVGDNAKDREALRTVVSEAKRIGARNHVDDVLDSFRAYGRLQNMGLVDLPTLRAALREFVKYRGTKPSADPIKAAERALVGVKIDGFFPTPVALAERLAEEANLEDGMSVLEPSAGSGRLADAVTNTANVNLTMIEQSSQLRDILKLKGYPVSEDTDFLEHKGEYDRIVMNPPFENSQDIDHVRRAFDMLAPGGRVVAIMSEGPFFRSDRKATEFREWLDAMGGTSEQLPENTFKESGTGVAARLVIINKPSSAEERFAKPRKSKVYYHVTATENIDEIKKNGLLQMRTSNWKLPDGRRANPQGGVFVFENAVDAAIWAARMEYETDQKISILPIYGEHGFAADPSQDIRLQTGKGKSLQTMRAIPASAIGRPVDFSAVEKGGKIGDGPEGFFKRVAGILERNDEERFAIPSERPFFSALTRGVESIKLERAPAVQWRGVINNLTQKGVKQEEIDWSGVLPWLEGQLRPVTKADVVAFLKENEVQVDEIVASGRDYEPTDQEARSLEDAISYHIEADRFSEETGMALYDDAVDGNRTALERLSPVIDESILAPFYKIKRGQTKFASYVIPGGENYRELLLTLPARPSGFDPAKVEIKRNIRSVTQGETAIWYDGKRIMAYSDDPTLIPGTGKYEQRPDSHWMDVARSLYERGDRINDIKKRDTANFIGGHFDEPNVLAHIRFNERESVSYTPYQINSIGERIRAAVGAESVSDLGSGAPGVAVKKGAVTEREAAQFSHAKGFRAVDTSGAVERVLFIEEIQSDWHQKGRKEGYANDSRYQELQNKYRSGRATQEETDEMNRLQASKARGVPDAPFKQSWQELAFKRALRWAAENGFDRVAWTTGEQQADRYDLSKKVRSIAWNEATGETQALDLSGKTVDLGKTSAEKLAEVIGKDAADKMKAADENIHGFRTLSGLDLHVGGEGMKGFYDKILPAFANKYGKKWGAKVEQVHIPGADLRAFKVGEGDYPYRIIDRQGQEYNAYRSLDVAEEELAHLRAENLEMRLEVNESLIEERSAAVHSLPITHAMRESVMQGQPLFAQRERGKSIIPTDMDAFERNMRRELDKMGLNDIASKLVAAVRSIRDGKATGAYGRYYGGLIEVSRQAVAEGQGPWTLNHEAVHALRDLGVFTPAEWSVLSKSAKADKDRMAEVRRRYEGQNLSDESIIEEAIADMFGDWRTGKTQIGGLLRRAFNIIKRAIEAIGNAVKGLGFTSTEGTFERIERGEVGTRKRWTDFAKAESFAEGRKATDLIDTLDGKREQGVIPGAERISDKSLIERRMTEKKKPKAAQKDIGDTPLFDTGARKQGELFALKREPKNALERQEVAQGLIAKGQPIDRAMRVPFDIFGGVDSKGQWKPGLKLHKKASDIIVGAKFSPDGRFAWMNGPLETARAGLVDRYGLTDEYVTKDRQRALDERRIMMQGVEVLKTLKEQNISVDEAKVLQAVLTGEAIPDERWAKVSVPIRQAIDDLGREAVNLGLVSPESYERNKGAYLHRVYLKHEGEQNPLGKWVSKTIASRRKKLIGSELKGRGLFLEADVSRLMRDVPAYNKGERRGPVKGDAFRILEQFEKTPELIEGSRQSRPMKRVFWPADEAVPEKFRDYRDQGTWEVRQTSGDKITLWRDYTKAEREQMGEILDARYTIGRTFMLLAHDLATGRFYKDVSENNDWTRTSQPNGRWVDAADFRRLWNDPTVEWVRVPDTSIPDTGGKKKWGALAGKWVRSEIWRDLNEVDVLSRPNVWNALLTQWKLNKTARSPVVHMNNVMSNVLFMDMADVRAQDLIAGIRAYAKETKDYHEAADHGTFGADIMTQEIKKQTLDPILEELQKQMQGDKGSMQIKFGMLGKLAEGIWSKAKLVDEKMIDLYRLEDEVFRMATYMRRRSLGDSPNEAADFAREQFLDYDIRAPWVNLARRSVLPFIAYTYRAVPIVAKSIAVHPWKFAKYVLIAYMLNAMAYAITGDADDEEEERRSLRKEERGTTWLFTPRMVRMPWRDEHGNPVFLDVRRWIPAGDIFDFNQPGIIPWAPVQMGGPMMLGAELWLNKQAFTGKEIYNTKTDDFWDKTSKVGDWAWKSWMPSAAWVPNSWYWEKVSRAIRGARDWSGNVYSKTEALLSSFGVKVKPQDVEMGYDMQAREFGRVERELKADLRRAGNDFDRGLISQSEYEKILKSTERKLFRVDLGRIETELGLRAKALTEKFQNGELTQEQYDKEMAPILARKSRNIEQRAARTEEAVKRKEAREKGQPRE